MFIQAFEVPETAVPFRSEFLSGGSCLTKLSGISNVLLSYFRRWSRGSTGNIPWREISSVRYTWLKYSNISSKLFSN